MKTTLIPCFCLLFLLCVVSGLPLEAVPATCPNEPLAANQENDDLVSLKRDLTESLQAVVKERQWPGATLAVALPDGRSFQVSAGMQDIETGSAMPQDARMLVGSTGKMFVSSIALQLVQEGKIDLDERINKYIGSENWFSLLPNGDEITVRQLMNHTSGLPRYVFQPTFLESLTSTPLRTWSIAERLQLLKDVPALHAVGKGWGYSDTNYIVLGAILEEVSGTTVYKMVQKRIVDPLKLTATQPATQPELPGLAQGYFGDRNPFGLKGKAVADGKYVLNPQFEWCGGGFVSSAQDLARLALAIHQGELIGTPVYEQLIAAVGFRTGTAAESGYGLGTFVWKTDSGLFYGHAGIMPGYLTQVEYSQSGHFSVALQCNSDNDMGRFHHRHVQQFAGQVAEFMDRDADFAVQADAIMAKMFPADQPGAAVIVLRDGQPIYKSARGMANLELEVPLSPDMVFRIGSITKQFTAAAIMMLVEEEKVSLDDEITRFLPDYPTQGKKITVRHLLNHTSGIRSYTSMPGWMMTKIVNRMSVHDIIGGFRNEPMDFEPGEQFRYNNSGYILLGAIIEKASGQSYADFIQSRIFSPLEMTGSYYGTHGAIIPNRASGYDGTKSKPVNARYLDMSQPYAAGSLLSTVEDMGKWNTALFSGKVVSSQSLEAMTAAGTLNDGSGIGYGFGLSPGEVRGHPSIAHGGGIFGFTSFGVWLPNENVYVAVLTNSTFSDPTSAATRLAALAFGEAFPAFPAVEVSQTVLEKYVGIYKIDETNRRYVRLKDGQLVTQRTGGRVMKAIPHSGTAFHYEQGFSHFEFVLEGDEVVAMKMFQDGKKQATVAHKVAKKTAAAVDR